MKSGDRKLQIKEQVYKDATGITFQFLVREDAQAPFRILMFSDHLPFGNREITIGPDGIIRGAGTVITTPDD